MSASWTGWIRLRVAQGYFSRERPSVCGWRTLLQRRDSGPPAQTKQEWCLRLELLPGARMHADYILLQKEVDLRLSFNIAESTTALSHLSKQVIAISIIHRNIQWLRPQTILTSRLTEINGAARKQSDPPALPPIPPSRLHLFLFSAPPIIRLPLHSDIISTPHSSPVVFICQDLFSSFCWLAVIRQPGTGRNSLTWTWVVKLWTWIETRRSLKKEK